MACCVIGKEKHLTPLRYLYIYAIRVLIIYHLMEKDTLTNKEMIK